MQVAREERAGEGQRLASSTPTEISDVFTEMESDDLEMLAG